MRKGKEEGGRKGGESGNICTGRERKGMKMKEKVRGRRRIKEHSWRKEERKGQNGKEEKVSCREKKRTLIR